MLAVAEHAAQESHDIDRKGTMLMDVEQQCHERCWNLDTFGQR